VREGLTVADDQVPRRLLEESLEGGMGIIEEEMNRPVRGYDRLRG
jgi:hypothetical protein